MILKYRYFPRDWKIHKIIPVVKSGDPNQVKNYAVAIGPVTGHDFQTIFDKSSEIFLSKTIILQLDSTGLEPRTAYSKVQSATMQLTTDATNVTILVLSI